MRGSGVQTKPSQPKTERGEDLTQFLNGLVSSKLQESGIKRPEAKAQVAKTESAPAAQSQGKGVVV